MYGRFVNIIVPEQVLLSEAAGRDGGGIGKVAGALVYYYNLPFFQIGGLR